MLKVIINNDREFKLALVTKDFIFYIDEEESDDNGNTIMYRNDKEMILVSDNYFASIGLCDELKEVIEQGKEYQFMCSSLKEYGSEMIKE